MKIYMKKLASYLFVVAVILGTLGIAANAQEMSGKEMKKQDKPTVAIIRANWCPACRKLEPTLSKLMETYGEKLRFVILDVTDEKTTAQALETAKETGLEEFFSKNKEKTSTVAIFKNSKQLFKTDHNYNRSDYVSEFDKALR